MNNAPFNFRTSRLTQALERVWSAIRRRHPDVPPAVIVVASGVEGHSVAHWGHWAAARWIVDGTHRAGEVKIAGERLRDGDRGVLETLLHEAAHALAFARDLPDTSRGGRYHNRRYAQLAEEVGLTVEKDGTYGWTRTALATGTGDEYGQELRELDEAITRSHRNTMPARISDGGEEEDGSAGKRILLVCSCTKPRRLRLSRSISDLGPILCGVCGVAFQEAT